MKITGISGSPREGNSLWLLQKFLEVVEDEGHEVHLVKLKDMNLNFCDGCLICEEIRSCNQKDDMEIIYNILKDSDVIVLATPVYFNNITGLLKNFIDRLNPLCEDLSGKSLIAIVVGQLSGEDGTSSRKVVIDYIKNISEILGINFLGELEIIARDRYDAQNDLAIRETIRSFTIKIMGDNFDS